MKKNKLIFFIFIITLLFMISGCMKSKSVDNSKYLTTSPSPTSTITAAPTIKPTIEPSAAPIIVPTTVPTVTTIIAPTTAPTITPIIAPTTAPTVTPIIQTGTLEEQSMDAYKKFLMNEAKISFDRYMPMDYGHHDDKPIFNKGSYYTLSEVLDIVTAYYFNIYTNKKMDYIDYSYIDCGKDGVNELVLRFNGMDIYAPDDDSTLVYIIKYIDGKLYLCYNYETWARCYASINEYGYFQSGGSNGASNHGSNSGLIDKDGNWQFIAYIESEEDINQFIWLDELGQLPKVAETKGISDGIEVDTIRFNDYSVNSDEVDNKEFYTFYVYDANWNLIEDENLYTDSVYKDIFDEARIPFITPDEVSTMISEKEENVGATSEIIAGAEIAWKTLDGNIFSDYLKSKVKLSTLANNGFHVFEDQSFDVKLDNFGNVRFVSGVDGYKNLWLYLVNSNNEIIYVFPDFYENTDALSDLQEVDAVSFKDLNKDGLKDITIIAHFITVFWDKLTVANVYFQKDEGFMNSYELDDNINDTNNNNSINEIAKYVGGLNLSTFGIK